MNFADSTQINICDLQDEGYVDINHVKEIKLTPAANTDNFPEEVRVKLVKHFGNNASEVRALRIVYGSNLAENRVLTFLCPRGVADLWNETLEALAASVKTEDPRMVWLKDQYLFLYYQDDLCMGPLAADAIKVIAVTNRASFKITRFLSYALVLFLSIFFF